MDAGSDNVECIGRAASSGDAATIDAQDAVLDAQLTASKRRKSMVTGVAVTLVLLLFIGSGVLWYLRYRRHAQIKQKRFSEQRARQYITTDVPSQVDGSTQIWETFDTPLEAQTSSAPIYEKRSRMPPEMPPAAMTEPDGQAPPYQEFEFSRASIRHVTTGRTALERVQRPQRSVTPRNAGPRKLSQSLGQDLPRLLTAAARSKFSIPKATMPSTGAGFSSSQKITELSLGLATTSEMASTYPEASASIPAVAPSISDLPGRKTSAGFVMFPQKSVRAPALEYLSAAQGNEVSNGNGSSAADGKLREHPRSFSNLLQLDRLSGTGSMHNVEVIVEDIVPPTYRSGAL
jgi:hypothetical protein